MRQAISRFHLHRARGFTLIEIMVVVVIMGVLAALVVPRLMGRTDDARILAAKQDIATLMQALKLYRLDNQRYPTTEQGLQALVTRPAMAPVPPNWKTGGYLDRLNRDPWATLTSTCRRARAAKSISSRMAPTASRAARAMMRTSARGNEARHRLRRLHGFTLLELLVVLVIVGIMLGAVALNAAPGDRQVLQNEAQRIALLLQLARDEAIVRNQPVAFEADDYRYRFLVRRGSQWTTLAGDEQLREREYRRAPLGLQLQPPSGNRLPLRIVFGREPVDKAFALTLSSGGDSATIRADGIGNFRVE